MILMQSLHPVIRVLLGTGFTWGVTALSARATLPYALAFAAGAMVFVVIEEVIPEAQRGGNTDFATFMAMLGFAIMMILDGAFR